MTIIRCRGLLTCHPLTHTIRGELPCKVVWVLTPPLHVAPQSSPELMTSNLRNLVFSFRSFRHQRGGVVGTADGAWSSPPLLDRALGEVGEGG